MCGFAFCAAGDGAGEVNLGALTEPVVVVAQDLFPSDTASLKREMVLAIVTEVGGATSPHRDHCQKL